MKKRILALVLSTVMLLGETLPVMAQNDVVEATDEAVVESEEDASEETEEIAEEGSDVVVEEFMDETEEAAPVSADAFEVPVEFEGLETVEKNVEYDEENGIAAVTLVAKLPVDETTDAQAAGTYWQLGAEKMWNIPAGTITVNDKTYDLNTNIAYYSAVNYRMRKIKAVDDLKAQVASSGIYDMAKDLTTMGVFAPEVIKIKYSEKKNKNAGEGNFTIKVSVDKKIAKALGISGKSLKGLKKAAKQITKAAKANKASFTIIPADFRVMNAYGDVYISITMYYNLFTRAFIRYGNFALRGRLEENAPSDKSKWKKIPSKDFKKKIKKAANGCDITITPKNKNLLGDPVTYELR